MYDGDVPRIRNNHTLWNTTSLLYPQNTGETAASRRTFILGEPIMVSEKRYWNAVFILGLIIIVLICPASSAGNSVDITPFRQIDDQGRLLDIDISGPGLPPENWNAGNDITAASDNYKAQDKIIDGVPALLWSYGCTVTSASMIFGYYDRQEYPDMYTGQTNGGIFPLTSVWGSQTIEPQSSNGENPLGASHQGIDGRLTKGHVDDYYSGFGSPIDPYYGFWTEHSADSLADFMGTNQYQNWQNTDGNTILSFYTDNSPTYDPLPAGKRDGAHGMKLFAEYRGYSVETVYNQRQAGFNGNAAGFTFAQYKSEIDNNNPVLIHVTGHSMVGVGYSDPDQIIFRNTWDTDNHYMTWGGSYNGMAQRGVTVFHLAAPLTSNPTVTGITPNSGMSAGSVSITNLAGTNFTSGAAVRLTRGGSANISATGVTVNSPTGIRLLVPAHRQRSRPVQRCGD